MPSNPNEVVIGSVDGTMRFLDLRTRNCVNEWKAVCRLACRVVGEGLEVDRIKIQLKEERERD